MERYRPSPEGSQPQDRHDQALELLEAGVESVLTSEQFKSYLEFMGNFHEYSYGNVALIMAQRPDATMVAGYRKWQGMGRQVRRGEQGITIITPRLRKHEDPDTGETRQVLTGFGTGRVFDVSQTDGDPLPEPPKVRELRESSDAGHALGEAIKDYLADQGVPVFPHDFGEGGRKGDYHPLRKVVRYQTGMSADQTAKTLTHEAAHHVVTSKPWGWGPIERSDHETVAEGAAFVVATRYGIDTAEYSFGYIAHWAQDSVRVKENLNAINLTAREIIRGIESEPDPGETVPRD